jgi:hypothetical protein
MRHPFRQRKISPSRLGLIMLCALMKSFLPALLATLTLSVLAHAAPVSLFDGKTFEGWEGDTEKTWRIVDGAFVGGSLAEKVPHNEFLATKKSYKNFDLRLKFKLVGTEGFVNGGVQFRSQRIPNHFEMIGYQADEGEGYFGSLYDESRRRKALVTPDKELIDKTVKKGEWNEYRIRCEGRHIQLWINGVQTADYTEADESIDQSGYIGLQVHGNGKTEAWYKDITIEELP